MVGRAMNDNDYQWILNDIEYHTIRMCAMHLHKRVTTLVPLWNRACLASGFLDKLVMPFGKHLGETIKTLPFSYRLWLSNNQVFTNEIFRRVLNDSLLEETNSIY